MEKLLPYAGFLYFDTQILIFF